MATAPKKSSPGSSIEDDVMGYMESKRIDNLASYFGRGRSHKDLSDQELTEEWVQAFKTMAENPRIEQTRADRTSPLCHGDP